MPIIHWAKQAFDEVSTDIVWHTLVLVALGKYRIIGYEHLFVRRHYMRLVRAFPPCADDSHVSVMRCTGGK